MEDWICVRVQCLPEVLHPSEIKNNSAIDFKAGNARRFHENNSETCRRHALHHLKFISEYCASLKHQRRTWVFMHTGMCMKGSVQTDAATHLLPHTYINRASRATLVLFRSLTLHPGCRARTACKMFHRYHLSCRVVWGCRHAHNCFSLWFANIVQMSPWVSCFFKET